MSEYHVTLRQFFHDFTPGQIRNLTSKIQQRHTRQLREHILAYHAADPEKLMERLEKTLDDRDRDEQVSMDYTEEQIRAFNIHITKTE